MNNLTALDKPEQLLQLVFGLLWRLRELIPCFCSSPTSCVVTGSVDLSGVLKGLNRSQIEYLWYAGGKFELSREDIRVWVRNAGETEVLVPMGYVGIDNQSNGYMQSCSLSHNLQWNCLWKAVWVCFLFEHTGDNGVRTVCRRLARLSQCKCECPLVSCAPASPALGTKSSQLPSLVLCYLCKVCCCWTRGLLEKLNWRIWRRLMFIRKLLSHSVPFLKV